jgi:hypothetical protein
MAKATQKGESPAATIPLDQKGPGNIKIATGKCTNHYQGNIRQDAP